MQQGDDQIHMRSFQLTLTDFSDFRSHAIHLSALETRRHNHLIQYPYRTGVQRFQQNFQNWTSGNNNIDEFIQKTQLKARNMDEVIEWVEYEGFENVEYLAKGGFGTTYKAIWKDGFIAYWDSENNQWSRDKLNKEGHPVALKCLHNSQDITAEFLREVSLFSFKVKLYKY